MTKLQIVPSHLGEACAFIKQYHRHHLPPQGGLFALAVADGNEVVGVVIVGRPVARMSDNGWTAEITRLCTKEGASMGAASKLYQRAAKIAQLMGYKRVISYILVSETGVSLKAAGWTWQYNTKDQHSWDTPSRPRVNKHSLEQKQLWEAPWLLRS